MPTSSVRIPTLGWLPGLICGDDLAGQPDRPEHTAPVSRARFSSPGAMKSLPSHTLQMITPQTFKTSFFLKIESTLLRLPASWMLLWGGEAAKRQLPGQRD